MFNKLLDNHFKLGSVDKKDLDFIYEKKQSVKSPGTVHAWTSF